MPSGYYTGHTGELYGLWAACVILTFSNSAPAAMWVLGLPYHMLGFLYLQRGPIHLGPFLGRCPGREEAGHWVPHACGWPSLDPSQRGWRLIPRCQQILPTHQWFCSLLRQGRFNLDLGNLKKSRGTVGKSDILSLASQAAGVARTVPSVFYTSTEQRRQFAKMVHKRSSSSYSTVHAHVWL